MIDLFDVLGFPIASATFFLALIASIILQAIDSKNATPKYTTFRVFFGLYILVLMLPPFISDGIQEKDRRNRIKEVLVHDINSKNKIFLNQKLLTSSDASIILNELRSVKPVIGHHSIPTEHRFTISIEYKQALINFTLEQDDKRVHEYWVHTDYFKDDKRKYYYIGRIYTDYFDVWTKPKGKNFY